MENCPLLTILVSFYNAEQHIVSCIRNLKAQTSSGFRCILVDDGSTDKSYEYAAGEIGDDGRFLIIRHEQNKGLGAGRETGIQNTQTEFLTFIDADDELDSTAVEKIIENIQKSDADLYVYDYFEKNEKQEVKRVSGNAKSTNELFRTNDKRISHVWHKVYKTSLLSEIDLSFYKTISFAEDLYICICCFMKSRKTILVPDAYYYYAYNGNSLVHSKTEKSIRENIAVLKKLLSDDGLEQFPEIKSYIQNDSFYAFGQLIFPNKKNSFQWNSPHFEEWRSIDAERTISIPKSTHALVRFYIALIRTRHDRTAKAVWNVLKVKESAK